MPITINASTASGLITTPDNSGALALQNNGVTGLNIDASGRVTTPLQPTFFAYRTSDYTINTTPVVLVYDTTKINIGSAYSTSTGRFVAPITGVYEFGWASIAAPNATVYRYNLYLNGTLPSARDELRLDQLTSGGTEYASNGEMCIYKQLTVGDYVDIRITSDAGPYTCYGSPGYTYTYFRGRLIG
jgi:hypothetical protein